MSPSDYAAQAAYAGAGDRFATGRAALHNAQADLARTQGAREAPDTETSLADLADAWHKLGRAFTFAIHLPPEERFPSAHHAMRQAILFGDASGSDSQRARWWSGLGASLKNLVADDEDDVKAHERNLEAALRAHTRAVDLARSAGDSSLLAAMLTAQALAYQYRDAGDRRSNLELAAQLFDDATDLYLAEGETDKAAVAATSCGIVWAAHPEPNSAQALERAAARYRFARDRLDPDAAPAHARRLGRSAGHAACRQGHWASAADYYALAWEATKLGISRTANIDDKRSELAEYGDSSGRHVYALARAGDVDGAVALADDYAATGTALLPRPRRRSLGEEAHPEPNTSVGLCYFAPSHVGTAAILVSGGYGSATRRSEPAPRLVMLDDLETGWLKDELAWPPPRPGHGSGVSSALLDEEHLGHRTLTADLLNRLVTRLAAPVHRAAAAAGFDHLYVVPLGVLADSPLFGAWTQVAFTDSPTQGAMGLRNRADAGDDAPAASATTPGSTPAKSPNKSDKWCTISVQPSAPARQVDVSVTRSRPPRLLTIALTGDDEDPLRWPVRESEVVAGLFPGTVIPLHDADATVDAVRIALDGVTHVHLAGHGAFAHTNPLRSYFECADGRLTLEDLTDGDLLASARLLIASACSLGAADTFRTPDQAMGLPKVLAHSFDCDLIAPIRPTSDLASALFTVRTAEIIWRGATQPPVRAAGLAQRWLARVSYEALLDWADSYPPLEVAAAIGNPNRWYSLQRQPDTWAAFTYFGRSGWLPDKSRVRIE